MSRRAHRGRRRQDAARDRERDADAGGGRGHARARARLGAEHQGRARRHLRPDHRRAAGQGVQPHAHRREAAALAVVSSGLWYFFLYGTTSGRIERLRKLASVLQGR